MKFGDKYELLESVTTGKVETFVANDKVRGERVLVHILHGDPQKSNQPTVQWVLEAFRRVAPEPAGLVLEAGRYSGTLYAYLVTKMPQESALRNWVTLYEAQALDTQEIPAPPPPPTPQSKAPTADLPMKEIPQTSGSVTQLLREFEPPAKSAAPNGPPKEALQPPPPPIQPIPTPPLPAVRPAADQSRVRMAPAWSPEVPRIPVPPGTEPSAGSSVESFRPDFAAKKFPSEVAAQPAKDGPKLGEFTSFFQGPFRGDAPSEIPNVTPRQEAPRKAVGDFTSVFGSAKPQQEEPLPAPGIAGNEPAGSFTGWFNAEPSRMSSTTTPPAAGLPRAAVDSAPFPAPSFSPSSSPASGSPVPNFSAPSFSPPSAPAPVFPSPVFPAPVPLKGPMEPPKPPAQVSPAPPIFPTPKPIAPSALPSDGATGAFSRPGSEPAPTPLAAPSGPSEYTQIISVRAPNPAEDAAGTPKASTGAASPPGLPKLDLPAPAAPKGPKTPKATGSEPPVSYWPLVLALTVIFFIAVLLVLYFVLKH